MEKVLVTGGLGFIGSNFIRHALRTWPSTIVNLDSVSYGANLQNLNDLEGVERYQLVKADTSNREVAERLVSDSDLVVHFAAETHVDRSISNPEIFFRSNVFGTFTLLEAARKCDVKRFVHISTDEVYGSTASRVSFHEEDRLKASSPYAASKAASDMFVEAYNRTYGLNTVILRCTNNFGPRQFPEKFIPKAIISAINGTPIPLYGNGMQIRDWIYVTDSCDAISLAAVKGEAGTTYNVSAGNEIPNLQVAKMILEALDKPLKLIQFVEDRPGHDFRYSLDSSLIRSKLGWKPEHNFREALAETVAWYAKNDWWWKPLVNEKVMSPTPWKEKW